jgi:hypothetical protein
MDSQSALKSLQDFTSTRKSAGDYYTQAQNDLGVNAAQQQANDLRGTIRNTEAALKAVPASVSGRTQGSLVTEAQRSRLQNIESDPISQRLGEENTQYGDQMQSYRDLLGQAQTRAGLGYQSDTDKASSLQQAYQNAVAQEQAAAAKAQQEEENRRWWEQFNYGKQQDAARAAQTQGLYNRINASNATPNYQSLIDAMNNKTAPAEQVLKQFTNSNGGILGYDTNRGSYLSDEGQKQEDKNWQNYQKYGKTNPSIIDVIGRNGPMALLGRGWLY